MSRYRPPGSNIAEWLEAERRRHEKLFSGLFDSANRINDQVRDLGRVFWRDPKCDPKPEAAHPELDPETTSCAESSWIQVTSGLLERAWLIGHDSLAAMASIAQREGHITNWRLDERGKLWVLPASSSKRTEIDDARGQFKASRRRR